MEDIAIGTKIIFQSFKYSASKNGTKSYGTIEAVADNEHYFIQSRDRGEKIMIPKADVEIDSDWIGADPFEKYPQKIHQTRNGAIVSVTMGIKNGDKKRYDEYENFKVAHFCFDPFVIDQNGKHVLYQRPLVWTLEEKQSLIESIYMGIPLGTYMIRRRNYETIKKANEDGFGDFIGHYDVVDGKQRIDAIQGFVCNEYPDQDGRYFKDLSVVAQRGFEHVSFPYIELSEKVDDAETMNQFLLVNFAGVPQSKEHIEFVKSIKV